MKSSLLIATLWLSTAVFAQYVQPATGQTYHPPSDPASAAPPSTAVERGLLKAGDTTSGYPASPLTDLTVTIAQTYDETPLGDVARAYRVKKKCCICPPHGHSGSIRSEKPQTNPDSRFSRLKSHSRSYRRIRRI